QSSRDTLTNKLAAADPRRSLTLARRQKIAKGLRAQGSLSTSGDILQPYDVVFAKIAANLHLDQFERNLAGIGEPMNAPNGDIDRLVFVHVADVIAGRDLSSPLHDDPMFRPVEVLLQREQAAGLHDNALDTITGGNIDVLV